MSRYEESTNEPYDIMKELISNHFPSLSGAKIHIIFDTKKKKSNGRLVFARIQSTSELQKYLSADPQAPEGYDYIMYIDKNIWDSLDTPDKKRIVFHELNHTDVDLDKKDPFGIKDHEIQMFESEVDFNEDDPKWTLRVSEVANSVYDKDK